MNPPRSIPTALRAWVNSPEAELTRWRRALINAAALGWHCAVMLRRDRAPQMAAALAYRTIFGLIPTLVLSLIVLRFFYPDSIAEPLRRLLDASGLSDLTIESADDSAAPSVQPVGEWIESLVARIGELNFAAIGVVGVGVLIYAALSLMTQVEQSFNTIYKAPTGRRLAARLTQYWTILTLGPLGVFGSFWLGDRGRAALETLGAGRAINALGIAPALAASWLALLLAYVVIPHARVRLRPALAGAFVAALLWETGKWGFGLYVGLTTGYSRFYGSLGLLPIFLLWIYITWLIILFGLELAYATQHHDRGMALLTTRGERDDKHGDAALAVATLAVIGGAFKRGEPVTAAETARAVGVAPDAAAGMLAALERAGVLHQRERSDGAPAAWSLSMPPDEIRLETLLDKFSAHETGGSPLAAAGARIVRDSIRAGLKDKTLADVLRETEGVG